jgi:hypothetical protein
MKPGRRGSVVHRETEENARWPTASGSRAKAITTPPAEEQHKLAKSGRVERKAHEAEDALEGPEGEELERARRETGKDQM